MQIVLGCVGIFWGKTLGSHGPALVYYECVTLFGYHHPRALVVTWMGHYSHDLPKCSHLQSNGRTERGCSVEWVGVQMVYSITAESPPQYFKILPFSLYSIQMLPEYRNTQTRYV